MGANDAVNVIREIGQYLPQMTEWRRHIHAHPETAFEEVGTARYVVERLKSFGVDEIHEGIAKTGIVAIINGQGAGPTIGLRADMDALPIEEMTGAEHASTVPGKMHACGHDGHTVMLLAAARHLARSRSFDGTIHLIFQPAEEGLAGARRMMDEGLFRLFFQELERHVRRRQSQSVAVGQCAEGGSVVEDGGKRFDTGEPRCSCLGEHAFPWLVVSCRV